MPELAGCCCPGAMSPELIAGFDRLRQGFRAPRGTVARTLSMPWARFFTMRLHAHDRADARADELYGSAWIGRMCPQDTAEASELSRSVHHHPPDLAHQPVPFAGCVAHLPSRTLFLVSDPFGMHPLYYALRRDTLIFGTKVSPLVRSDLLDVSLDAASLLDFLTYEHPLGDGTLVERVKVLPPGSILEYREGRIAIRGYFQRPMQDTEHEPPEGLARALFEQLGASVKRSMEGAERVGITLSGGLDSRALLGCALRVDRDRLRTFTFGHEACRDVRYAAELARCCGVPHEVVPLDASEFVRWLDHGVYVSGGMVNCIHYHILSLADVLATAADVVLDGLGGDALTGGHLERRMLAAESPDHARQLLHRRRATGWANESDLRSLLVPDVVASNNGEPPDGLRGHFARLNGAPAWVGCHRFDLLERQRRFIQYGPHLLRPFVNVQTPFYDGAVVKLLAQAPVRLLAGQRAYLAMHARHLQTESRVPDSARGVPVGWPRSVRSAKRVLDAARRRIPGAAGVLLRPQRQAPTDYAAWFRGELRPLILDRLLDPGTTLNTLVRPGAVEKLVHQHMAGLADHSVRMGCLLTLDAWQRSLR